jgi:hypothetical protein
MAKWQLYYRLAVLFEHAQKRVGFPGLYNVPEDGRDGY